LKIAFDEHIAPKLADAVKALSGEEGMLRAEIVSARQYAVPKAKSDVPWLERFAKEGGKVVVSGDARMRGKLHEQAALIENGFVVFFFSRQWNQLNAYAKTAMLIKWWPVILAVIESAAPGQCFEIPCSWQGNALKEVTPPAGKRRKPGRKVKETTRQEASASNPPNSAKND